MPLAKNMLIKVKVKAGVRKPELIKKSVDSFEIKIKEQAERGEANKAVINVLADYFSLSPKKVRLIKGAKKPNKIFKVCN